MFHENNILPTKTESVFTRDSTRPDLMSYQGNYFITFYFILNCFKFISCFLDLILNILDVFCTHCQYTMTFFGKNKTSTTCFVFYYFTMYNFPPVLTKATKHKT